MNSWHFMLQTPYLKQETQNSMEFREPGFWIALLIGLCCLGIFIAWLWKGGRKPPLH